MVIYYFEILRINLKSEISNCKDQRPKTQKKQGFQTLL